MKRLMKLTMRNAKSIYTEANNMNILKLNVAVFSSLLFLLFLLFADVDTAVAEPSTQALESSATSGGIVALNC